MTNSGGGWTGGGGGGGWTGGGDAFRDDLDYQGVDAQFEMTDPELDEPAVTVEPPKKSNLPLVIGGIAALALAAWLS